MTYLSLALSTVVQTVKGLEFGLGSICPHFKLKNKLNSYCVGLCSYLSHLRKEGRKNK